jgi:xylulose-5-phosphate/fructose-6-phosphate phosphoketolase
MTMEISAFQPFSVEQVRQAHGAELDAIARYQRVTDYLVAAELYLKENVLLEEPLKPEHIKDRSLGHWGTSPGINLIYAHLNHLILRYDLDLFLVTGPGHGAPANLANLYLEGTLHDFYPDLTFDRPGLKNLYAAFPGRTDFPVISIPASRAPFMKAENWGMPWQPPLARRWITLT